MRVLQVHCTYKYPGGEDSVVASERNLLQENGVTVEALTFNNTNQALLKVMQAPFNVQAYNMIRKKINEFKPDVVHLHNIHFAASPSVIFAIRKSGVPFVHTLHNYRLLCPSAILYHGGKIFLRSINQSFPWSAVMAGVYKNSKLLTGWVALTFKMHQWMGTWEKADRYIVLTKHAQELFQASGIRFKQDQLLIKPNFCPTPVLPLSRTNEHFVFIGRLSEEKGIDLLLETFATLPYTIRIAGDGPLKAKVEEYAKKYPSIEYVGSLNKEQVPCFLAAGAALIFPSVWYEGMPMVIIEALACRLPVIASRLGAMEEMIVDGNNGLHFKAGNADSLRKAIVQYKQLTTEEQAAYRNRAYQSYLDHYTPEKNASQLLQIYRFAIEGLRFSGQRYWRPIDPGRFALDKLNVFNIPVNIGTYREFIGTILENARLKINSYTCVANVHMLVEAYFDRAFSNTVKNAHMIAPDGQPLTWAIRLLYGIRQERVAGMDLLPDLLRQAQDKEVPVYFYGAHPSTLERAEGFLHLKFPRLKIAGMYSPPFHKLSEVEEEAVVQRINASGAQLVFVALGCPKQEKWMAAMTNRINSVLVGVGGALPVMIGEQKRAPRWMQSNGLEWLFRLSQEPKRLLRRYVITNSMFLFLFLRAWLQHRLFHRYPIASDLTHS